MDSVRIRHRHFCRTEKCTPNNGVEAPPEERMVTLDGDQEVAMGRFFLTAANFRGEQFQIKFCQLGVPFLVFYGHFYASDCQVFCDRCCLFSAFLCREDLMILR